METNYTWLVHPLLGVCTSVPLNLLPAHLSFPCFQMLVRTFILLLSLAVHIPLPSLTPSPHSPFPKLGISLPQPPEDAASLKTFYLETIQTVNFTPTSNLYLYPGTLVIGQLFKVVYGIKINPHLNQNREKL